MDGPFEHIDPQVVFVIVALVIGALQALWEKRKRSRAARELDRQAGPAADRRRGDKGPAKAGTFRELYEEYRRQVTAGQAPPPGQPETLTPQPAPEPAQPPPLPAARPARAKSVDAAPEPWAKEAPAPWQTPRIRRAQEVLGPQELAALARLQQHSRRHPAPPPAPPAAARRLLASPTAVRDAIIVRELLGPPKGLGPLA